MAKLNEIHWQQQRGFELKRELEHRLHHNEDISLLGGGDNESTRQASLL